MWTLNHTKTLPILLHSTNNAGKTHLQKSPALTLCQQEFHTKTAFLLWTLLTQSQQELTFHELIDSLVSVLLVQSWLRNLDGPKYFSQHTYSEWTSEHANRAHATRLRKYRDSAHQHKCLILRVKKCQGLAVLCENLSLMQLNTMLTDTS